MTSPLEARRLVITAVVDGFLVETDWQNRLGDWSTLSRTFTREFPLVIVGRVADRADYRIHVRST